ncbi:MAG: NAD(P)-binding protein [Myxococcota bacterium]|nr:NAD(P)-binding protein [Myxococcota bacterium]
MGGKVTRRDFLNGAALTLAAGTTLRPGDLLAEEAGQAASATIDSDLYPPVLTGMRGNHKGAYEVAHALAWRGEKPTEYKAVDDRYDLVIVGGGLSGLASAYLYRQKAGPDKKILILENHDDFGGHAKRNEFHSGGRMLLGFGGSINLEQDNFSDNVHQLLKEIGVDLDKLDAAREPGYAMSEPLSPMGYFLNAEQYGQDRIVEDAWMQVWLGVADPGPPIASLGLPVEQQKRLLALVKGEEDLLDELSVFETLDYVGSTSYREFLRNRAGLSPATIGLFEPTMRTSYGIGPSSLSVTEVLMAGAPGLKSLGITARLASKLVPFMAERLRSPIFPDGNASVARLLVRQLIPGVAPGNTMEDVVEARFDYSQLDRTDAPVRIRLNSTAVHVENRDAVVEVSYVQDGQAYRVTASDGILACYNGMIPHICPELPEAQKQNLKYGVKAPLVWTNVLLRNGESARGSGAVQYCCPGSFFELVYKAPPVSLGNYRGGSRDSDPLVLWMAHVPSPEEEGTKSVRDLFRDGRRRLYTTPFATFETEVKKQLTAMFGPRGFDADRDIEAITVNRWAHGYAYEYLDLDDPKWETGQAPHELGRKPFGRVSIANSDSEASAYLHAAIDAAWRAVAERLGT